MFSCTFSILFLYRNRNPNWQSASPVFLVWYKSELCDWLYGPPSLCLLFKGLEISAISYVSNRPHMSFLLVVGFNL